MSHLTKTQRYTIERLYNKGLKQTEIAKTIGKHKSVVCRELKRNYDKRSGVYRHELAKSNYKQRLKDKPKHISFTVTIKSNIIGLIK